MIDKDYHSHEIIACLSRLIDLSFGKRLIKKFLSFRDMNFQRTEKGEGDYVRFYGKCFIAYYLSI